MKKISTALLVTVGVLLLILGTSGTVSASTQNTTKESKSWQTSTQTPTSASPTISSSPSTDSSPSLTSSSSDPTTPSQTSSGDGTSTLTTSSGTPTSTPDFTPQQFTKCWLEGIGAGTTSGTAFINGPQLLVDCSVRLECDRNYQIDNYYVTNQAELDSLQSLLSAGKLYGPSGDGQFLDYTHFPQPWHFESGPTGPACDTPPSTTVPVPPTSTVETTPTTIVVIPPTSTSETTPSKTTESSTTSIGTFTTSKSTPPTKPTTSSSAVKSSTKSSETTSPSKPVSSSVSRTSSVSSPGTVSSSQVVLIPPTSKSVQTVALSAVKPLAYTGVSATKMIPVAVLVILLGAGLLFFTRRKASQH